MKILKLLKSPKILAALGLALVLGGAATTRAYLQLVPTMAVLASYNAQTMALVSPFYLADYYTTPATNAGGTFLWYGAGDCPASAADGGLVLAPSDHPGSVASGCLVRQTDHADPVFWGDKVDGETNAATAWQSAFDNALNYSVKFQDGVHYVNANLAIHRADFKLSGTSFGSVLKLGAAVTRGIQTAASGLSLGCTGTTDFCPRINISNFTLDVNATANSSSVIGILLHRTWDSNVKFLKVLDSAADATSRYHVVFQQDTYTSSLTDSSADVGMRAASFSALGHTNTTISFERDTFSQLGLSYTSNVRIMNSAFQGVRNKIITDGAAGPLAMIGNDLEGAGNVVCSTNPDGAQNWFSAGNNYEAVTGVLWSTTCGTSTFTGTTQPTGSQWTDLGGQLGNHPATTIAQSGHTVTVTLDTTLYTFDGFTYFRYEAPNVGDYVNVSGTGAGPDGSWYRVTSRTVDTGGPTNQFTYEVSSSAVASYCSAMSPCGVLPDNNMAGRFTNLFGNGAMYFDPLGKDFWLTDGYALTLGSQNCLSSLIAPNSGGAPVAATQINLACSDSLGRTVLGGNADLTGSRWIVDPAGALIGVGAIVAQTAGIYSANATGGDKGVDTLNVKTYYADGTVGFTGSAVSGGCTLTIKAGLITGTTGC